VLQFRIIDYVNRLSSVSDPKTYDIQGFRCFRVICLISVSIGRIISVSSPILPHFAPLSPTFPCRSRFFSVSLLARIWAPFTCQRHSAHFRFVPSS
jgi:hypothetical protein